MIDSIRISRVGRGVWLRMGLGRCCDQVGGRLDSHSAVRCGCDAVRWPMGGGQGGGEARSETLLPLAVVVLLLLTKRRGDAGLLRLRVCGLWGGLGRAVQCGAAQRSAAQETRRLGRRRVQKLG